MSGSPHGISGSDVTPEQLLAVAREAALAGAAVLLEHWERGVSVSQTKSTGTDMVSAADLGSEAAIRAVLAARRPHDIILGEEGGLAHADGSEVVAGSTETAGELYGGDAVIAARAASADGLVWICDPLDGTTNFLYGLRAWAVSIAVRDADGVVAGVVADPLAGELFTAFRGGEARIERVSTASVREAPAGVDRVLESRPLLPASTREASLATSLIGTGMAYNADVRAEQAKVIAGFAHVVRDFRRTGAAALDLCWVAAGRLDAYYERTVRPWDVAAGLLICELLGLDCRYLPPVGLLPDGVFVAPPAIADELWSLVSGGATPIPGAIIDHVA